LRHDGDGGLPLVAGTDIFGPLAPRGLEHARACDAGGEETLEAAISENLREPLPCAGPNPYDEATTRRQAP
jgi:hypothetical protein